MVRINSGTVAKYLGKFSKPRVKSTVEFDVSPQFLSQIRSCAEKANNSAGTQRSATSLLSDLFKISKTNQQKVILGSLMLEHSILPIKVYAQYLRALVAVGQASEAVRQWKRRIVTNERDRLAWKAVGVQLLCRTFRVHSAEKLVECLNMDEPLCMEFINGYAQLKQSEGLERWINKMGSIKPSAAAANKVLAKLIECKMWSQVQLQIEIMSTNRISIDSESTVACLEANSTPLPAVRLATLLSIDGNLINLPRFRRLIANPDSKLSNLLSHNRMDEALDLINDYNGPQEMSLCYEMLQHLLRNPPDDSELNTHKSKWIDALVNKVSSSGIRSSIYVQFMLTHLEAERNLERIFEFLESNALLTAHPKIQGKLSYSNYVKLWRLMNQTQSSFYKFMSLTSPFSLVSTREFASVTLQSTALQPPLLRLMAEKLNSVPDMSALVSLLEFSATECNVNLDLSTLNDDSTGCHGDDKQQPKRTSLPHESRDTKTRSSWQAVAQYYCSQHGLDLASVEPIKLT